MLGKSAAAQPDTVKNTIDKGWNAGAGLLKGTGSFLGAIGKGVGSVLHRGANAAGQAWNTAYQTGPGSLVNAWRQAGARSGEGLGGAVSGFVNGINPLKNFNKAMTDWDNSDNAIAQSYRPQRPGQLPQSGSQPQMMAGAPAPSPTAPPTPPLTPPPSQFDNIKQQQKMANCSAFAQLGKSAAPYAGLDPKGQSPQGWDTPPVSVPVQPWEAAADTQKAYAAQQAAALGSADTQPYSNPQPTPIQKGYAAQQAAALVSTDRQPYSNPSKPGLLAAAPAAPTSTKSTSTSSSAPVGQFTPEMLAQFQRGTASKFNPKSRMDMFKMRRLASGQKDWASNPAYRASRRMGKSAFASLEKEAGLPSWLLSAGKKMFTSGNAARFADGARDGAGGLRRAVGYGMHDAGAAINGMSSGAKRTAGTLAGGAIAGTGAYGLQRHGYNRGRKEGVGQGMDAGFEAGLGQANANLNPGGFMGFGQGAINNGGAYGNYADNRGALLEQAMRTIR